MVFPPALSIFLTGEPQTESGKQPTVAFATEGKRATEGNFASAKDVPMSILGRADFSASLRLENQPLSQNHIYQPAFFALA